VGDVLVSAQVMGLIDAINQILRHVEISTAHPGLAELRRPTRKLGAHAVYSNWIG
jgi:hypothetical protein